MPFGHPLGTVILGDSPVDAVGDADHDELGVGAAGGLAEGLHDVNEARIVSAERVLADDSVGLHERRLLVDLQSERSGGLAGQPEASGLRVHDNHLHSRPPLLL